MLLFCIQFPEHTLLLPASLCSLRFTDLPPDCKSSRPPSPKKSHLVNWFSLSHTLHTNHLIISWCGLVYCRDVTATEEPQYLAVLSLAFLYRKQSLEEKNFVGISNWTSFLPHSITSVTYLVSFILLSSNTHSLKSLSNKSLIHPLNL